MNKDFFKRELGRLADAFGVPTATDKWKSRSRIYYESLVNLKEARFGKIVSLLVKNEERFPTINTVLKYAQQVPAGATAEFSECIVCNNSGVVHSYKVYGNRKSYYAFRCPECNNSDAAYPKWDKKFADSGHKLEFVRDDWDENDEVLIKGLATLKDTIVWRKATQACRDKADELLDSGWKPKLDMGGCL